MTEMQTREEPAQPVLNLSTATATDIWEASQNTVISHELVEKDAKPHLIGIPFLVTGVTYRDGDFKRKDQGVKEPNPDYVSVEAMIAPHDVLARLQRRGKIGDVDALPFAPGELIVFNDRSAGIYRQITEYLHLAGLINALKDGKELVEAGPMFSVTWDNSRWQWRDGMGSATDGINLLALGKTLRCPHGLRLSEYENEFNPESRTFYLA